MVYYNQNGTKKYQWEQSLMDAKRYDELIEKMAYHLRRWGLTVPGVAFLEANKPFAFLGSQLLLFLQPLLNGLVRPAASEQ